MLTSAVSVLGEKWKGLYNPAGRGFPDVAALGVKYAVKKRDPDTGEMVENLVSGTR
jgi:tripeptidyl-peptidase-1